MKIEDAKKVAELIKALEFNKNAIAHIDACPASAVLQIRMPSSDPADCCYAHRAAGRIVYAIEEANEKIRRELRELGVEE